MAFTQLSKENLSDLLNLVEEVKIPRQLRFVYRGIPTPVEFSSVGCFNIADVYFIEFLNICFYLQKLNFKDRKELAKSIIKYELLSLAKADLNCPFLVDDRCLIDTVKPLHCRFYGCYPDDEYEELSEKSVSSNILLAQYYARNYRILLPKEVMTYKVKQVPSLDSNNRQIVLSKVERERFFNQVISIENRYLSDELLAASENELYRFSFLYCLQYWDADKLEELRLKVLSEHLTYGNSPKLQLLLDKKRLDFGQTELKSVK